MGGGVQQRELVGRGRSGVERHAVGWRRLCCCTHVLWRRLGWYIWGGGWGASWEWGGSGGGPPNLCMCMCGPYRIAKFRDLERAGRVRPARWPLGFAGPSRSFAAELLWRYGALRALRFYFYLSHFDDTVLTGVAIRGQNGLLRYRDIAISPLMKALVWTLPDSQVQGFGGLVRTFGGPFAN